MLINVMTTIANLVDDVAVVGVVLDLSLVPVQSRFVWVPAQFIEHQNEVGIYDGLRQFSADLDVTQHCRRRIFQFHRHSIQHLQPFVHRPTRLQLPSLSTSMASILMVRGREGGCGVYIKLLLYAVMYRNMR